MQKRKHEWTAEVRTYNHVEAFARCVSAPMPRFEPPVFAPWSYLRRSTIEWRNGMAFGAGIGEGARVISPRREIRRIGPNRSVSRPLRCPRDCGNPRDARISAASPEMPRFADWLAERSGFELVGDLLKSPEMPSKGVKQPQEIKWRMSLRDDCREETSGR